MKKVLFVLAILIVSHNMVFSQCPDPVVPPEDLVNVVVNPGFETGNIDPSNAGPHIPKVGEHSAPGMYMVGGLSTDFNAGMIPGIVPHTGNFMLMIDNILAPDAIAWEQTVTVQPNKMYYFSAWLTALHPDEKSQMVFQVQPVVPAGPPEDISDSFIPPDGPEWEQFHGAWFSGAATSVTLRLINSNPLAAGGSGNDFAIDDIMFRPTCVGVDAGPRPDFGTSSIGLCNVGGSADLNSNVPDHFNHIYTWYKDEVEVPNPLTPDILEDQTTVGTYRVCLDSMGCVNSATVTLTSDLVIDLGPDLHLCDPAFKLLDTRILDATGFDIKWFKDNVEIPGQVATTYMATGAGTYRVEVTDGASCTGSDEIVITSQVDETIGDFICPSEDENTATVSVVDAGGTYNWYDQPTGGTLLGTGLTYTDNSLTEPTIFYVENTRWPTSAAGLTNATSPYLTGSTIGLNNNHPQNYMNFTALKTGQIDFVTVRLRFSANATGNVTITLENKTVPATVTATHEVTNTEGAGDYDFEIPVDMEIVAGNNYWFSITGVDGQFFTMRYEGGAINTYFPSTYEAVRLIAGQANTVYPSFFNWKFSHPSSCARTPASVTENCPLPVDWLSFDGTLKNDKVFLNWSTAIEINNSFFEIQRSVDGIHFESIGKVNGAGNTQTNSRYFFIDDAPLEGISYYRIVQHDFDGMTSHTNIIAIRNLDVEFKIFPNPSNSYFTILAPKGTAVVITNVLGQVLLNDTISSNEYRFGESFISGAYIVSLILEDRVENKVLIKE